MDKDSLLKKLLADIDRKKSLTEKLDRMLAERTARLGPGVVIMRNGQTKIINLEGWCE